MKKIQAMIFFVLSTVSFLACSESNFQTKTFTYQNVRIEYYVQGSGPAIVILPSLGRSGRDYDNVAAYLEHEGFKVFRPEPRGIGESKGPMDKLTVHDFSNDIAHLIEHEHIAPAIVVGHAWGNFPARMLATDHPELVKGVVLVSASAGKVPKGYKGKPISPEIREAIDGAGETQLSEAQRLIYLKKAFFAAGNDPKIWLSGWHRKTHDAESWARNNTPVDEYFAAGNAPILDLQGDQDAVAPKALSHVLKDALGDRVTIKVIKNAGHAMAPEQPRAMAEAIGAFAHSL